MIDDKKQNDIMDADFDDFDDLDDGLADDGWDDFDDPLLAKPQSNPLPPRPRKKSVMPRLVGYLVILLMVVGGSYFFYTQFIVPTAQQKAQQQQLAADQEPALQPVPADSSTEFVEAEGLPPMPAPVSGTSSSETGEELTPMPDLEDITAEQLPELDFSNAEVQEAPPADGVESSADNQQPAQPQADNSYTEQTADVVPAPEEAFEDVFNVAEEVPPAPSDIAQTPVEAPMQAADIKALEEVNTSLTEKLRESEAEVAKMAAKVQQLEEQIAKLESKPAPKPKTETKAPPAEDPAKKAQPVETTAKKSESEAPKPASAPASWRLRSAQPGKAVVSPKNSDDMRTVEVGDSLSGIGRVQSVAQVNGRWVVQGSHGSITQ